MWYDNFDVDLHYKDALESAQNMFETINQWHQTWQKNMNEMQDYLLGLQEATSSDPGSEDYSNPTISA